MLSGVWIRDLVGCLLIPLTKAIESINDTFFGYATASTHRLPERSRIYKQKIRNIVSFRDSSQPVTHGVDLDERHFKVLEKVGQGGYGTVYRVSWKILSLEKIPTQCLGSGPAERQDHRSEDPPTG